MRFGLFALVALFVTSALPPVTSVQAATCATFNRVVAYSYNPPGGSFGTNYLTLTSKSNTQVWRFERSDDSGGSWYTVQQSTAKSYYNYTDTMGDDVRLRVLPVNCSGVQQVFEYDPVAGPLLQTFTL
jgi:hypothetical protein